MKITHLIFSLNTGGAETMMIDIINNQVVNNQVTLIILNDQINEELIALVDGRVKLIRLNRGEKSRNPWPVIRLNWLLLNDRPDVIHAHHYNAIRIMICRKNVVLTVHTTNDPVWFLGKYKKVFVISNSVRRDIESRSSVKPILVYNGIDTCRIRQKTQFEFNVFKIVMISRMVHEKKGQHILIEAIKILVKEKKHKDVSVDFIGEGPSWNYLKQLVKTFDIEDNITFLGNLDRTFIYEHLKDYDLLVQPSLFEGFGLTIAEAMTAKVPVLVSDVEGPMEVIGNGKFGWFFVAGDASDCAEKLQRIINGYQTCIPVVNKAYERAVSEFDIMKTSNTYLKYY